VVDRLTPRLDSCDSPYLLFVQGFQKPQLSRKLGTFSSAYSSAFPMADSRFSSSTSGWSTIWSISRLLALCGDPKDTSPFLPVHGAIRRKQGKAAARKSTAAFRVRVRDAGPESG
jgi:hypothetical protein